MGSKQLYPHLRFADMMPQQLRFGDEDDILRDVRRVIGQAFDMAEKCPEMRCRLDHYGMGLHRVDQIVENFPVKVIDKVSLIQ